MHIRGSSIYFAVVGLTSTTAVLAAVPPYGQYGGSSFQGETTCADGWSCTKYNEWYSQCVGGQNNGGGNTPAPTAEPSAAPAPSSNMTSVVIPTTLETAVATPTAEPEAVVASSAVASAAPQASAAPGNGTGGSGKNGANCSIDAAFKAHGKKYIGVATDQGRFSLAQNAQIIQDNFGQVTPENRYVPRVFFI